MHAVLSERHLLILPHNPMYTIQVYAVLSARYLQLNARFVKQSFVMGGTCNGCTRKTVSVRLYKHWLPTGFIMKSSLHYHLHRYTIFNSDTGHAEIHQNYRTRGHT